MNKTYDAIVQKLVDRRIELGMTRKHLAIKLCTNEENVRRWEKRIVSPQLASFAAWMDCLNMKLGIEPFPWDED